MDRKLLDYLPPVLREVMEMRAVNGANEPEIALAWDALTQVLANQFLETADAQGVAVWEKELGLLPKDTDSLAERKTRIKAKWNMELPYSFPWLKSWLTGLYGKDGHEESVEGYTLLIQLRYDFLSNSDSQTTEVLKTLRPIVPENMLMRAANKYSPVVLKNRQAFLLAALCVRARASNFGQKTVVLDGRNRLDGTWLLNQGVIRGQALHRVRITISARNQMSTSGRVTSDAMWRLDGTCGLDGAKKLNAEIKRSEL